MNQATTVGGRSQRGSSLRRRRCRDVCTADVFMSHTTSGWLPAVAGGDEEVVPFSLYLQANGVTPLFAACLNGNEAVVRALLASGAAVNQATTVRVRFVSSRGRYTTCSVHFIFVRLGLGRGRCLRSECVAMFFMEWFVYQCVFVMPILEVE